MAFAVLHIQKGKAGSSRGLSAHIERSRFVHRADPKKAKDNFVVEKRGEALETIKQKDFKRDGVQPMEKKLKSMIDEYKADLKAQGKKALRKDAVTHLNIILTSDKEKMRELQKVGKLEEWAKENYRFVAKTFGAKNIVNFAVHCDETTPHIHCTVMPMVEGRLCAKELMNPQKLVEYQDSYAKAMEPFGMERGIHASKEKHEDTSVYEGRLRSVKFNQNEIPNIEKPSRFENLEKFTKIQNQKINDFVETATERLKYNTVRADKAENSLKFLQQNFVQATAQAVIKSLQNSLPSTVKVEPKTIETGILKPLENVLPSKIDFAEFKIKTQPRAEKVAKIEFLPLVKIEIPKEKASANFINDLILKGGTQTAIGTDKASEIVFLPKDLQGLKEFKPRQFSGLKVKQDFCFCLTLNPQELAPREIKTATKNFKEQGGVQFKNNVFIFPTLEKTIKTRTQEVDKILSERVQNTLQNHPQKFEVRELAKGGYLFEAKEPQKLSFSPIGKGATPEEAKADIVKVYKVFAKSQECTAVPMEPTKPQSLIFKKYSNNEIVCEAKEPQQLSFSPVGKGATPEEAKENFVRNFVKVATIDVCKVVDTSIIDSPNVMEEMKEKPLQKSNGLKI